MTTTLVGTPDPEDDGYRLDWLEITLLDHVARIEWLIRTSRQAGAGKRVVWELEASLELATAALRHLGDKISNADKSGS